MIRVEPGIYTRHAGLLTKLAKEMDEEISPEVLQWSHSGFFHFCLAADLSQTR